MLEKNNKTIFLGIVVAAIIVAGALIYIDRGDSAKDLPLETAAEKAIIYINENFLSQGITASLVNASDEGKVYKVHVEIKEGESVLGEFDSYVSKDGEFIFPEGYSMIAPADQNSDNTSVEIPKNDKPDVNLFVMSFCPYGNQAEDTMLPVYNLLKDKVNWNIHYIVGVNNDAVTSLHGQLEVDENEREVCVLQESGIDKWWQFTTYVNSNCGSDGSCWQTAAEEAGLDVSAINNCVSSKGLSLMTDEAAAANEAGASGSPTLIINGVATNSVYQYGNSQAYLDAICSGFNSAPQECSQQLASEGNASSGGVAAINK